MTAQKRKLFHLKFTQFSQFYIFSSPVIIDHAADPSAPTGDFELIHVCPIGRFYPPQKIQLNIDGKKINPPKSGSASKPLFRLRNFSDLIVKGEKLFKPLRARLKTVRTPMEMKHVTESEIIESSAKQRRLSTARKSVNRVCPLKIYRSPIRQRNIFHSVAVRPPPSSESSDDATCYVRKLPNVLKSQTLVNLSDLMRYLKVNENLL